MKDQKEGFADGDDLGLSELKDQHREMLRLFMLGADNETVAIRTGFSKRTVSMVRNSPAVRARLDALHSALDKQAFDAAGEMASLLPDVVEFYKGVIKDPNRRDEIRAKVAKEICDRGGLPIQREISTTQRSVVSLEAIEDAKKRALQAARENGMLYDVEVVEDEKPAKDDGMPNAGRGLALCPS